MVVMFGPTADVCRRFAGERAHRAGVTQQLERAVGRRQPQAGVRAAGVLVQLGDREAPPPARDCRDDGPSLRRHPHARRQADAGIGVHGAELTENDSQLSTAAAAPTFRR